MFSYQIVSAIEVLLRMKQAQEEASPKELRQGFGMQEIDTDQLLDRSLMRLVFRKLLSKGYIAHANAPQHYKLATDPHQITILDLVALFHGDICIGEIYDHYLTRGRENYDTQFYQNLRAFESVLHRELRQKFNIPITEFYYQSQLIQTDITTRNNCTA